MLDKGDRILVTGASGFIGSALTRALLEDGYQVVALVEPGGDVSNLKGVEVELVAGDLRHPAEVLDAMRGCRAAFHAAALYRFWAPRSRDFYDINVIGTRHVLDAARVAGLEKLVFTSTVGTLGIESGAPPADETCFPDVSHLFGSYKRSKYVAEHEVLRAAAEGLPVSIVLPTFPLGRRDRVPTPSGRLVLDFLNGRMPGYVDTILNVVHVEDVARGHVLALERGAVGRSYILGGTNLSLRELLADLAAVTGLREPTWHVPRPLTLGAAWVSETVEGRLMRRHPAIPLEAARMSTTRMAFNDSRARREIGYRSRPAVEAIEASARWFCDNGYVHPRRRSKLVWTGAGVDAQKRSSSRDS